MRTVHFLMITGALLCLWPSPARGDDLQRARAHFERGTREYKLGRFVEALAEFQAGLKLVKRHSFYFNIAQCQRQLVMPAPALKNYERYLQSHREANAGKDPANAPEVKRYMARLKVQVKKQPAATQPSSIPVDSDGDGLSDDRDRCRQQPAKTADGCPAAVAQSRPFYQKWWFWTAVGVVVVAGTTTGIVLATRPGTADPVTGSLSPGTITFP